MQKCQTALVEEAMWKNFAESNWCSSSHKRGTERRDYCLVCALQRSSCGTQYSKQRTGYAEELLCTDFVCDH